VKHSVWVLGLALALVGCGSTEPQSPETVRFADELGIDLKAMTKLPSGVYYQTVTAGTGGVALKVTDRWSITYKGWLANGEVFDAGSKPLTNWNFNQVIDSPIANAMTTALYWILPNLSSPGTSNRA